MTGIVAADGISGNWIWWCWAIAHLVSTFFFARMWQRSGVITDAEITDLVQFGLGMVGAIVLAVLVVGQMGGMGSAPTDDEVGSGLLGELASSVGAEGRRTLEDVLDFVPPRDHPTIPPIYFVVLLTVGWWRYAEGNGYLVQRMAACRDEGHAQAQAGPPTAAVQPIRSSRPSYASPPGW